MILVIDNYDSFVYNLVQYVGALGQKVKVARNDAITVEQALRMKPARLLISPGPGRPEDSGICMDLIRAFNGKIPILGVCLGHQCLGRVFGADVVRAGEIVHGKTSMIKVVRPSALFKKTGKTFQATRYHSLVVDKATIKPPLIVTATTTDGRYVMGLEVAGAPTYGIQFHPESIETPCGMQIIKNFLAV